MSRKGENIYKRKDGRYEGRYIKGKNLDGKTLYGYVYSKSYYETKQKLIKEKSKINFDVSKTRSASISDVVNRWLEVVQLQHKASTYAKYKNIVLKHILPEIGCYLLSQLNSNKINDLCHYKLFNCNLSPKTVKDILSVIKQIIKYARKLNFLCDCNFDDVHIKVGKNNVHGFSNIECNKIINHLIHNINYVNIGILISFYTGIRIGELCALKINDLTCENTIVISKTMQRIQNFKNTEKKTDIVITTPKTESSIREIPLPKFIVDNIKKYMCYDNDAFLLTGKEHSFIEPRTLENKFKRITSDCGIENVKFHMIRHTFASNCIEAGVDVKTLSEILGHSSVNITLNRYVHSSMNIKKNNMQKFYKHSFLTRQINSQCGMNTVTQY